ncbi:MAG: hypothetical protein WEA76_06745 [Acidimicrobiia bacterium]
MTADDKNGRTSGGRVTDIVGLLRDRIARQEIAPGARLREEELAAAFRREIEAADDPRAREAELEAELRASASPFRTSEAFGVEEIIDPRETRAYLCRFISAAQGRLATTVGPKSRLGVRP